MKQKKWVSLTSKVAEGEPSKKRVSSSEFMSIYNKSVDERGVGSTKVVFELSGFWQEGLSFQQTDFDVITTADSAFMQQVGYPALPQEGIYVAIPDNSEFKEFRVIGKKGNDLTDKYYILPAPKPVFEGEEIEYIPLKEAYNSDNLFPGKVAEYMGTKTISGKKVVHIMLYPFQYRAKSQTVSALSTIEVEVLYETVPGMDSRDVSRKTMPAYLRNLILDSDSIPGGTDISDAHGKAKKGKGLRLDAGILKNPANRADFVIITVDNLKDSFAAFETVKKAKHETMIVTKNQIMAEFPDPNEDVAIRNFLVYATTSWALPPQYVVLGGNIDIIPTHMISHAGVNIPSDHYYADLTGDICPDIQVSRFPASNAADMTKICDVAANYNRHYADWRKNVLLTTYNRDDYNQCKNEIATTIGNSLNVIKKYDGVAPKQEVINTINAGVGFANYRGHGSETRWQAGNGLTNADIPGLGNVNKSPQVLSIACLNNSLDTPGYFGSTWMVNQKAVTFLGASRPSYTTTNHSFDKYLWDGIVNQHLEAAGDIFNWGTVKLFQNVPGENTKHNIYMYLLLGDPTANYKETIMPTETTVGFVLMLDTSGTMQDATSIVKIDAKAFVRESRAKDQFGVNQFNDNASWVYPANGNIVTVSPSLAETDAAAQKIESAIVKTNKMTNLGNALQLGNSMIAQATTDQKAFVILSDGMWNQGPNPSTILGNTPPIFVAGLGPYLQKSMFQPLLDKNPNSRYYHQPNAWEMMQVFNDIRALPLDVSLMANRLDTYNGSDYKIIDSYVAADSDEAQFVVVWSDNRFKYTSGNPSGYNINVQLIDPNGKTSGIKPVITDGGYCIFNVSNIQPGMWRTLVQYGVPSQVYGTTGSFQLRTQVTLEVVAPSVHALGKPLSFLAKVLDEGQPVEGVVVSARIKAPVISVQNALTKYKKQLLRVKPDVTFLKHGFSDDYSKLHALRINQLQKIDILPVRSEYQTLKPTKDGFYQGVIRDTKQAGSYTVEIMVKGINSKTKKSFSRVKLFSTLVG